MTHTVRIELADVAAWPNLEAALWAAARGKRMRPDVAAFIADAPRRLAQVRHALLQGRLPDGRLQAFAIRDPKPRLIHAAPFADRVAQHALMRLLEPRLEAALVPTSFACRPGRGVHAALTHALLCTRRWPWVLQLDVAHCFPSIPHTPLLALVRRRLRGSAFDLLAHIVGGHAASPGRGLPIGSLTSQHLANQYLGELDRAAIAHPATRAHVRYMDDVLLWCDSAADARALRDHLLDWLPRTLGLQFKPPVIQRSNRGFTFCGFRLRPDGLRLGRRRQRAWRHGWRALQEAEADGRVNEAWLQQRAEVLRTLALPTGGAIRAWRRAVMAGPPGACGAAADAAAADDGAPGRGPAVGASRSKLGTGRAPNTGWGAAGGCCAVAAGSTTAGTAVLRSATRTSRMTATTTSASAWPERWPSAMLSKPRGAASPAAVDPAAGEACAPRRGSRQRLDGRCRTPAGAFFRLWSTRSRRRQRGGMSSA